MKVKRSNLLYVWFLSLIAMSLPVWAGGCTPEEDVKGRSGVAAVSGGGAADSSISAAVNHLRTGDFEGAKAIVNTLGEDSAAAQLRLLLERRDGFEAYRRAMLKKAYHEQIAELAKIEAKAAEEDPIKTNTLNEAMAAVVRAREYADEADKAAVLELPFVKRILETMKERGASFKEQGKWVDAYSNCYYWLSELYEDNQEYKDIAERLSELASIELSLKDSGCGESAAERNAGIKPEMLLRALNALETNYVNGVDYGAMMDKALTRCELLGEVLLKGSAVAPEPAEPIDIKDGDDEAALSRTKELVWKAEAAAVSEWAEGLSEIRRLNAQLDKPAVVTVERFVEVFDNVLKLNASTLKLPQEVVIAQFSEAALAALDPFTTLVWPWNVKDFEKSMTQQFTGIGIEISKRTGVLKVVSLLPDTPAYKSGLDADDEILAVNGESTAEMTIFCAVSKITGPKGSKVTLSIRRPSTGRTWDVTLVRDKIVVQPLRGWRRTPSGDWDYMIDPANGIGYVRLTAFTETSGPDLDKTLTQLEKNGLTALILDLRFNSGGYLSSAAEVVDLFVREGVIVKSNPRHGFATYEIAHRSGTHPDYPLVVLINGGSASASEIVAGALQDPRHQRATLVGERSYGKGSVQVVTPFTGGGSQLKYTIAYYHLPSDQQVKNRYQMERQGRKDWGIAPDVEVKVFSNELRTMVEMQRDNDVLFRADHDQDGQEPVRHSLEKTLLSDPQLATALMIAQAKLTAAGKTLTLKPWEEPQEDAAPAVKEEAK